MFFLVVIFFFNSHKIWEFLDKLFIWSGCKTLIGSVVYMHFYTQQKQDRSCYDEPGITA